MNYHFNEADVLQRNQFSASYFRCPNWPLSFRDMYNLEAWLWLFDLKAVKIPVSTIPQIFNSNMLNWRRVILTSSTFPILFVHLPVNRKWPPVSSPSPVPLPYFTHYLVVLIEVLIGKVLCRSPPPKKKPAPPKKTQIHTSNKNFKRQIIQ